MRKYHLQIRLVFLLPFPSRRWVFPSLARLPWRDLRHNAEYRWRERTPIWAGLKEVHEGGQLMGGGPREAGGEDVPSPKEEAEQST